REASMTETTNPVKRAGVIGLGAMGLQMARHMATKGFAVMGYDVSADATARAQGQGVKICGSIGEVADGAEVVVVMVATEAQVREVAAGLINRLARGAVICIASSVSPDLCRELEATAAEKGVGVLDTPVVLGQEAANNGTLTIYVGGTEVAFERAKPVLAAF